MAEPSRRYNLRDTSKKPQGVLLKRWEVEYSKVIGNENRRIPLENAKTAIRSAFEDGMFEQWRITLKCPLSGQRIKVPARYADCTHIECFDLEAFLRMKTQKNILVCPICQKEIEKPLANLRIDEYMETVLSTLPEAMQVELLPDGSFTEIHEEFVVKPNVINDEEPFVPDNNTSAFEIKQEALQNDVEYITINDGEDESTEEIVEMKPISLMPLNMDIKPKIVSPSEAEQIHSGEDQEIQETLGNAYTAIHDGEDQRTGEIVEMKPISLMPSNMDIKPKIASFSKAEQIHSREEREIQETLRNADAYTTINDGEDESTEEIVEMKPISLTHLNMNIKPEIVLSSEPEQNNSGEEREIQMTSSPDRRKRRSASSRSRFVSPRRNRRSRSRSSFSSSPSPRKSFKRLQIANLDDSVRLRDVRDAFRKFGRLSEMWVTSCPPFYAFVAFEKSEDASDALKEMRSGYIRNCHVRTALALYRNYRRHFDRSSRRHSRSRSRSPRRRSRVPHKKRSSKRSRTYFRSSSLEPEQTHSGEDQTTQDQQNSAPQTESLLRKKRINLVKSPRSSVESSKKGRVSLNDNQSAGPSARVNAHSDQSSSEIYLSSDSSGDGNDESLTKNDRQRKPATSTQVVLDGPSDPVQKKKITTIKINICYGTASFTTSEGQEYDDRPLSDYVSILRESDADALGCESHIIFKTPVKILDETSFRSKTVIGSQKKFERFSEFVHSISHLWNNGRICVELYEYSVDERRFISLYDFCEALFNKERAIFKCRVLEINWLDDWWSFSVVIPNVAHHCKQLIFKPIQHPIQKLHITFLDILYTLKLPRNVDVTLEFNYKGFGDFIDKLGNRFQSSNAQYFKFKLLCFGFPGNKFLRNDYGTLRMKIVSSHRDDSGLLLTIIEQCPHTSVPDQQSN